MKNPFYNEKKEEKQEPLKKCPYCGAKNLYSSLTCKTCYSYIYPEEEEAAKLIIPEDTRKYNPMSIISLILGITGIIVLICYPIGILTSIGAILVGRKAQKELNTNSAAQKGEKLAFWGITCGIIAFLGALIIGIMDYIWKLSSLYSG